MNMISQIIQSNKRPYSLASLVFILVLLSSIGPLFVIIIYEFIRFHELMFFKGDPVLSVFAASIFFTFSFIGFIVTRITTPINALVHSIKNYRIKKSKTDLDRVTKITEFRYLFSEFESMIKEIENYQRDLIYKTHLAAIGETTMMVAHDIRKPLTSIQALLRILPFTQGENFEINKVVLDIETDLQRTNTMLSELLDYSKNDVLTLDECCLEDLITSGIKEALRSNNSGNLSIKYFFNHKHFSIIADTNQLVRVFVNIILNSLEAMDSKNKKGTEENVISFTTNIIDRKVVLSISDNGPGIHDEIIEKIFTPFFSYNKKNGNGLGLAICKKIVLMHRGNIWAENNKNGITFLLELPSGKRKIMYDQSLLVYNKNDILQVIKQEPTENKRVIKKAVNKLVSAKNRINFLAIDDDCNFLKYIEYTIKELSLSEGINFFEAHDAKQAYVVLEQNKIDCMMVDFNLGEEDIKGIDLIRSIFEKNKNIYASICSSNLKEHISGQTECLKNGSNGARFFGIIQKPLTTKELLSFFTRYQQYFEMQSNIKRGKKILLVNDSDAIRWSMALDLESFGYTVIEASNVKDALLKHKENRIAAIVSDINFGNSYMEGGFDFITKIRMCDDNVPFIFVSAYDEKKFFGNSFTQIANAYLQLPYSPKDLERILARFI